MMNRLIARRVTALALALVMVVLPVASYADDGKKYFKRGLQYEANKQWDKAAEQFALAAAAKPSSAEYALHLQRALVNAGIMLVERGDMLAEQKDYNAAYQAYRQAYAFDPTNELALIKMRRMLEIQGLPTDNLPKGGDPAGPSYKRQAPNTNVKVSTSAASSVAPANATTTPAQPPLPRRRVVQDIVYRGVPLMTAIEQLAQSMRLNVVFDAQSANIIRNVNNFSIDLRGVNPAKALEIILQSNNLMYAQVDTRTIVVASDLPQNRMRYEQQAVRTFYIKNADLNDVRTAIQGAFGGGAGKQIIPSKQLNAIIVRDTPANLELIEALINSLDKSKAEVLIDINMYEISREDLLQIGNQLAIGDQGSLGLSNLGGIGAERSATRGGPPQGIRGLGARTLIGPFGFAIGLPNSAISFFQGRGKTKLLASTQVHILDGEQHQVRIGQRVPVQTASLYPGYYPPPTTGGQTGSGNPNTPGFGLGFGFPQIQYENVGLNIDMQPSVYEDEIQMKMKIESSSVGAGPNPLTPTFNQRQMSSVARVKDGQTAMIAGVSQNQETKSVKGLPLIGLIPILGRFFTTPDNKNTQSDVVITVTPHILRRADIREEDHLARDAGYGPQPSRQLSIEQILYLADQEEAQAGQMTANAQPEKTPQPPRSTIANPTPAVVNTSLPGVVTVPTVAPSPQPINPTSSAENRPPSEVTPSTNLKKASEDDEDDEDLPAPRTVTLSVRSAPQAIKGQQLNAAVIANGNAEIQWANLSLSYDPNILEVKGVRDGGLMRAGGASPDLQFTAQGGVLNVQMERPAGMGGAPARGQLLFIIFEVKNQGHVSLMLNEGTVLRSPSGQILQLKLEGTQVEVLGVKSPN
jgi:general secretion pathway protein D